MNEEIENRDVSHNFDNIKVGDIVRTGHTFYDIHDVKMVTDEYVVANNYVFRKSDGKIVGTESHGEFSFEIYSNTILKYATDDEKERYCEKVESDRIKYLQAQKWYKFPKEIRDKIIEIIKDYKNMENMKKSVPLMDKPTDEMVYRRRYNGPRTLDECSQDIVYGRNMTNEKYHGGESTWSFPEGVKDKIENDKLYRVWYHYTTPSDPSDTSVHYIVYYIEEYKD